MRNSGAEVGIVAVQVFSLVLGIEVFEALLWQQVGSSDGWFVRRKRVEANKHVDAPWVHV